MKINEKRNRFLMLSLIIFTFVTPIQAQILKKLGKRAEKAAERTVENRVDREIRKKTDAALDSILEPGAKQGKNVPLPQEEGAEGKSMEPTTPDGSPSTGDVGENSGPKSLSVYSKFDFVPGDKQLFFDDFSNDFVGDFPARWNTNGGGEIVNFGDESGKWLELVPGSGTYYIPDLEGLPQDYTIEFDIQVSGVERVSSSASLRVALMDDSGFKSSKNMAWIQIPLVQWTAGDFKVWNRINGEQTISNSISGDIRSKVMNRPHISIAVNGPRLRVYVDESKYVDIPRMIGSESPMTHVKYQLYGIDGEKERAFISNVKIAKGGEDLRRKLLSEGKISTNGILFDSGSNNIKPESMGIIRQVSQVLQQESSMSLQIIGHTDADGSEDTNLKLSKDRAAAVKNALVTVYSIDENRLSIEGKGETEPVEDNTSPDGKSQNRRVEFIKQ
jgi:outer membrane protein OmpA-like peptidoglycan-associated protein